MIMNMSIEKMLSHVYEIEGLMLVTRRLGDENTPEVITNKIQRKVRELAEMCGVALDAPQTAEAAAEAEQLSCEQNDAHESVQHDNDESKDVLEEDEKVPVADREPDDDITVEWIEAEEEPADETVDEPVAIPMPPVFHPEPTPPVFKPVDEPQKPEQAIDEPAPEMTNDEPVPEPDPELVPEAEAEPMFPEGFIEVDTLPEPEDEMPLPPLPTDFPEVIEEHAAPMRVDEKLQRNLSKDIRKAFSVNDRFLYQRELFAGSASAMDTALDHIEMMSSYGNAELYFYSQLHWDRENEVVQDFMNIVRNHYQK